jgi:hypothetical protein
MSNTLFLNQNFINVGLGTMTYTIAPTLTNPAGAGLYNVAVQGSVPSAISTGDGAGSGKGPGSGKGGGDAAGFARGGLGLGDGAVGQGFGPDLSGYSQPIASGSNQTSGPAVSSSLSIVVNLNGTPVYTMPALAPTQDAFQFKTTILCANADVITVVLSSANANDNQYNTVKSNISIGEGAK